MSKTPQEIFKSIYYPRVFEHASKFIGAVPETIYHYTNVQSFMEILQRKKLWASRSEFLNDPTEFRYGQRILSEQITELKKSDKTQFPVQLDRAMTTVSEAPFITCFCRDGDLLSQWRGYSNHGQGICIGFRSSVFTKIGGTQTNSVVYDPEEQASLLYNHLKILSETYTATGIDCSAPDDYADLVGFTGHLERDCALVKDPAFKEEGELRCVVPDYNLAKFNYHINYRVRNSLIVPYIELDLSAVWDHAITEIIIGPGPDREIRKSNIEHFLKFADRPHEVKFSNCQFR